MRIYQPASQSRTAIPLIGRPSPASFRRSSPQHFPTDPRPTVPVPRLLNLPPLRKDQSHDGIYQNRRAPRYTSACTTCPRPRSPFSSWLTFPSSLRIALASRSDRASAFSPPGSFDVARCALVLRLRRALRSRGCGRSSRGLSAVAMDGMALLMWFGGEWFL